jgi:hypothetical protein
VVVPVQSSGGSLGVASGVLLVRDLIAYRPLGGYGHSPCLSSRRSIVWHFSQRCRVVAVIFVAGTLVMACS